MISRSPIGARSESGNVIFFVLLAIVLIGLVTVALRSGGDGANIDAENTLIRTSQIRQYASDLERGVAFIMRDGASESEISFANENNNDYGVFDTAPSREVFNERGGGVEYMLPPSEISAATQWEFYGHTHLPDVGTSAPELVAVLPNVTRAFCDRINDMNGYSTTPVDTTDDCIHAGAAFRFTSGTLFTDSNDDTVNEATFSVKPAMQGCLTCSGDPDDDSSLHFFHVLMAR